MQADPRRAAGLSQQRLDARNSSAERPRLERAAAGRVRRVAIGDLGDVAEPGRSEMRVAAARGSARAPPPGRPLARTRTHASTNGPISHGQTVPW